VRPTTRFERVGFERLPQGTFDPVHQRRLDAQDRPLFREPAAALLAKEG
jgi:hypothetical protein